METDGTIRGVASDKRYLGENCIITTDYRAEALLNNNIIVNGSNARMTALSYAEMVLSETKNSNIIMKAPNRDMVDKYGMWYREAGYDVYTIDIIHPHNSGNGFDPLHFMESDEEVDLLTESIIMADPEKENHSPWHNEAAKSLLAALIHKALIDSCGMASFSDVLDLFYNMEILYFRDRIQTSLDSYFEEIKTISTNNCAYTSWRIFRSCPANVVSEAVSMLGSAFSSVFSPAIRDVFGYKQIDFKQFIKKKSILFILTSPLNPAGHNFANIMIQQIAAKLCLLASRQDNQTLPVPVEMLLNEFTTGCKMPRFAEYMCIFPCSGISASILIRNENSLYDLYGRQDAAAIIHNCDRYILMGGCMDPVFAESMAERTGKRMEDILYMPAGKEYVLQRGRQPVFTDIYNITKNSTNYRDIEANYRSYKLWSEGILEEGKEE